MTKAPCSHPSRVYNISLHWATLWIPYRADDPWLRNKCILCRVPVWIRRWYSSTEVQQSSFTDSFSHLISKPIVTDVVMVRVGSAIQMWEHAEMDNSLFFFCWQLLTETISLIPRSTHEYYELRNKACSQTILGIGFAKANKKQVMRSVHLVLTHF